MSPAARRFICRSTSKQVVVSVLALLGVYRLIHAADPTGVNAMIQLDRLPYLSSNVSAAQQSSYDRTGGNGDAGNFLYSANGENVMLDLKVPGCVYCIWTTGFNYGADQLKTYIDGETQPSLTMTMGNLFSGTNAPFLTPLAGNSTVSSGGFYSYVPIPFAKSIRITTTGSSYYHVGYHTYMPDAVVAPWTTSEDVSVVRANWQHVGADPKPATASTVVRDTATLGAGQTHTVLDIDGPKSIVSIRFKMPELGAIGTTPSGGATGRMVTDNGRAHKGYSEFTVAVNAGNQGVRLVRRFDFGIANQTATVSVDNSLVGTWTNTGGDIAAHWRDSSFVIPASFTTGKSSITIRVTFVSSANDWNEFFYWVYSKGSSTETVTDSVDVGTTASETAHNYTINGQTWTGTQTYSYPGGTTPVPQDVLNSINLKIFWDSETTASVDAPLGSFFAMGQFGSSPTRSLMVGVDTTDFLYCYFPMPFARHATVQLVSTRATATANVVSEIKHAADTDPFDRIGYFKTKFNHETHTGSDGTDILFLDVAGSGKFMGVIESMLGDGGRGYLEGDERFYVDNCRSPAFHGTGTEDFYNAGWYFQNGVFSLPMQGNPTHLNDGSDHTAAYRFLLHDAVDFRTHMHASIEHGDGDGSAEEVWSLAYYYLNSTPSAVATDSLDVGNAADEVAHNYTSGTPTFNGSRTSTFEGIADKTSITETGKALADSSGFTMAILPVNRGVLLHRMFDQNDQKQSADVYIDNSLVGTWYHAGSNTTHRWREDEFMVPSSSTEGKTHIRVGLRHTAGTPDWNEFKYRAYTLTDTLGAVSVAPRRENSLASTIRASKTPCVVSVYAMNGRCVGRFNQTSMPTTRNLEGEVQSLLPAGAYLYQVSEIVGGRILRSGIVKAARR